MIQKEEFLAEEYETFRKDAEAIIRKLETGGYSQEIDETHDPLEAILRTPDSSHEAYQNQCSFFQFFSEIYRLPYVKNIIRYAEEQGFSLYGPDEMKEKYSMEQFVQKVLPKKANNTFTQVSCFDLMFVKKTNAKKVTSSDLRKVTLLEQKGTK